MRDPEATALTVNGSLRRVTARGDTPLLYVLRNDLELNGPKFGCGLGECGACMVLIEGRVVQSCAVSLKSVGTRAVATLEGLGTSDAMHPVQAAFVAESAAQCGYCLNGMIMTIVSLLGHTPGPSDAEIAAALRHNLCRCGAHVEILRAARAAARLTSSRPAAAPAVP